MLLQDQNHLKIMGTGILALLYFLSLIYFVRPHRPQTVQKEPALELSVPWFFPLPCLLLQNLWATVQSRKSCLVYGILLCCLPFSCLELSSDQVNPKSRSETTRAGPGRPAPPISLFPSLPEWWPLHCRTQFYYFRPDIWAPYDRPHEAIQGTYIYGAHNTVRTNLM